MNNNTQAREAKPTYYQHSKFDDQFSYPIMGRPIIENRRYTVAGVHINNELRIGIAICSEKDQFDKQRGRSLARRNAFQKPIATVPVTNNPVQTLYEFIDQSLPKLNPPIAVSR